MRRKDDTNTKRRKEESQFSNGFHNNFKSIDFIKLSLHGYIILVGQESYRPRQQEVIPYRF
jgi:hypothetical protein